MNRFYHGGHVGDLVYALYAIKKFGGGELFVGPHDHSCWNEDLQNDVISLCSRQSYISRASRVAVKPDILTYDFTNTWRDQKLTHDAATGCGLHLEQSTGSIASCDIKTRDVFNLFKYELNLREMLRIIDHNESWIEAPRTKKYDIVCHFPKHKMVRGALTWTSIFDTLGQHGLRIAMIGGDDVLWWGESSSWDLIKPWDFLDAADYINSARLFIGSASSNYVIAEGLDQFRFVESHDADGADPKNPRGYQIIDWSRERVIDSALRICSLKIPK